MRVLEVTASFYPNVGGVETFVGELAGRLKHDHGVECLVLHSHREGPITRAPPGPQVASESWPADFNLATTPVSLEWFRKARGLLNRYQPDLVHVHIPLPGLPDVVAMAAVESDIPFLVTYHNDIVGWNPIQALMAVSYNLTLGRKTLQSAARIVVDSSLDYAKESRWLTPHLSKTTAIRPGISNEFLNGSDLPEFDSRARDLIFVGRQEPGAGYKGLPYLLKSLTILIREIPSITLTVVGSGTWEQKYRNLASELGLSHAVKFMGAISRPLLIEQMRAHKVMVMPSTTRQEGFGLAILEGQSQGLAVVASKIGGIPSAMLPNQTGYLVPPSNAQELAAAIRLIISDRDLWTHFSREAVHHARSFRWDNASREYHLTFKEVLATESPSTKPKG